MKNLNIIKSKNKITIIFLFLVFFLALFLRIWRLNKVPPSLFGDEVDTGYQAYSILKTGKDYFGNRFPIHFQSFGDWRVPLYIYMDTIFIKIFGLNERGVRLPAAIFGSLAVLATYFLTKHLTRDDKVGLLASFLLAVSPWHIHFSRGAFEAIIITFLFPLGFILFFKGMKEKKMIFMAFSALAFGLTPYAYNTPKLFLPLIIMVLIFLFRKEFLKQRKESLLFIIVLGLILLPQLIEFISGPSGARFGSISIFANPEVAERVRLERDACDYSGPIEKILHNKVNLWAKDFIANYLSAFSLDFLFVSGDPNPRHSLVGRGQLYLYELPFLLLGLGLIIIRAVRKKDRLMYLIFIWLLLAPIPSALTQNGGRHAIRLLLFLPALQIVTALGMMFIFGLMKSKKIKKILIAFVGVIVLFSFGLYWHEYFVHFPKTPGRWWNYGYREAFEYVREAGENFNKIYVSSSWEPSIVYTLFYSQYPPYLCQQEIEISPVKIGKYHFLSPDINRIKREGPEPKTLYILNPGEMENLGLKLEETPSLKKIKEILAPDGSRVRVVFTGNDLKQE